MKKLELIKAGIEIVVSVGVGAIVGNAIKATTPGTTKGLGKLFVAAGSVVLTGIFSDMATKYTEDRVDNVFDSIKKIFKEEDSEEIEVEQWIDER